MTWAPGCASLNALSSYSPRLFEPVAHARDIAEANGLPIATADDELLEVVDVLETRPSS